jgi:hypothetical protein
MNEANMQGRKTHEQQTRMVQKMPDVPDARRIAQELSNASRSAPRPPVDAGARQSEFPLSRGGMSQESRDHNKHNHSGQAGHRRQVHGPAEEKH